MDLDVLFSHEESRQAMARLAAISVPLGKRVLQYIRLFKPGTRQLGHGRVVKLIEELLPDMQRHAITHNGRDWQAPLETWSIAFDRLLERRDTGKLTLPLKSHGYLYEVIAGMVDKAESAAESKNEAERRARRPAGEATNLQSVTATLQPAPVVVIAPPQGPSAYALKVKADADARKRARESTAGESE